MLPVFLFLGSLLLGSEHPVSAPEYGIAFSNQQGAAVAGDVTSNYFLVVWPDPDAQRIWAARVGATGRVLTQPPLLIAHDRAINVRLFRSGDHYVALWLSDVENMYTLQLARLDDNGALLGPVRAVLPNIYLSALAWNGRNFLLAVSSPDGYELVLLSPDGDIVKRGIDLAVPHDTSIWSIVAAGEVFHVFQATVTVVTTTDRFGNVTYSSYSTVNQRRVSTDGELLDPQPLPVVDRIAGLTPAVASNGRSIAGVIYDQQATLRPLLIDAATGAVTMLFAPLAGREPRIATDGSGYLLSWIADDQTLRTMPFGDTADATPQQCCRGAVTPPAMAWNGRTYFGVWSDNRDSLPTAGYLHLYGTLFFANGQALDDGRPIATAARTQTSVSTAGSLVVWSERDANASREEVRASLGGGEPIVLSPPAAWITTTAAVAAGSSYFAGWTDYSDVSKPQVFMRRIGSDAPRALGPGLDITFAFDGTNVLAVWLGPQGVVGQRFKPDGNIVDVDPFVISATAGFQPRVATNGHEFLVAWWQGTNRCVGGICPKDFRDVVAALVSKDGTLLETIPIATGGPDQFGPVVASDGLDFIVAYVQDRSYARRVQSTGALLDPAPGFPAGSGTPIDAAWRNGRYLIAAGGIGTDEELHVFEVDPKTTTLLGDTLVSAYATASQPFGGAWIAYSHTTDDALYGGAVRAFTRPFVDGTRRRSF